MIKILEKLNKREQEIVLFCIRADIVALAMPLHLDDLLNLEKISSQELLEKIVGVNNWEKYIKEAISMEKELKEIDDLLFSQKKKSKTQYYCKLCAFEGPRDQFINPETLGTENEELICPDCNSLLIDKM